MNEFNFDKWLKQTIENVYYFRGWYKNLGNSKEFATAMENLFKELKTIIAITDENYKVSFENTHKIIEKYLLLCEFGRYRKYLAAEEFFPLPKDVPEIAQDYILLSVLYKSK